MFLPYSCSEEEEEEEDEERDREEEEKGCGGGGRLWKVADEERCKREGRLMLNECSF